MTISEVSEKYEISQDTLRYYERIGAIPPVHRTKGGVRDYTEEDTGWIELVKCMRSAGLSVEAPVQYVKLTQRHFYLCFISDAPIEQYCPHNFMEGQRL